MSFVNEKQNLIYVANSSANGANPMLTKGQDLHSALERGAREKEGGSVKEEKLKRNGERLQR